MMKILLALHTVAIGGMETLCVDVAAEFHKRGHLVHVLLPRAAEFDPLAERFERANASLIRITTDFQRSRSAQARELRELARCCRSLNPDVIHLHTGGTAGGLALVAVARMVTSATVLYTEHDVSLQPRPSFRAFDSQSYHWFMRVALDRLAHATVAVSRRNARIRRDWLDPGEEKLAVTINGIPIRELPEAERLEERLRIRKNYGIADDAVVIGTLCRLAPRKGLDDLLRAFAQMHLPDSCRLLLVGDGPLRERLEELAKELNIFSKIVFAGFHRDAAPFLSAMDTFVLAVPEGSMSIALLEAMGHGVPSVITFCGPEEAVVPEKTGLGAPPNNPAGLAASLQRLVDDPGLRATLGRAGAEHVRKHFSIQRVADDWLDIYKHARSGVPERLRVDPTPVSRPTAAGLDEIRT